MKTFTRLALVTVLAGIVPGVAQGRELTARGTEFFLDGKPFVFTGVSFFNALYNDAFNDGPEGKDGKTGSPRRQWLEKFRKYGINVLRVWGQWNSKRGFFDVCPDCSLITDDGGLHRRALERLTGLLTDADALGMVVELAVFAQESWNDDVRIGVPESEKGLAALVRATRAHRNLTIQIWNEFSERVPEYVAVVKKVDPRRLVTNAPGFAGYLGDPKQNDVLDYLTPHTSRRGPGKHWVVGPSELRYLRDRFGKPVVDDEPARNGTPKFGGPTEATSPHDHILQIAASWAVGAYVIYHHDMFQSGKGAPEVPPHGIPDPEWSPYHRQVFEFLAHRDRYFWSYRFPGSAAPEKR